jgi:hypothetical protein
MIPFEVIDRLRRLAETLYKKDESNEASSLASAIADVVQATGKPAFYADTPFGVCPFCGNYDEVLPIDRKNHAVCHEHHVYWYIGTDHLAWLNDTSEISIQNRNLLASYTQIAVKEAFPSDVCPCCGLFIVHAAWCIMPSDKLDKPSLSQG